MFDFWKRRKKEHKRTKEDLQKMPDEVLVVAQDTPNPFAIKFIVNKPLKSHGKATFQSKEEAKGLPLVESLFDLPGVIQVYIQGNTLTLTHDGSLDNEQLKPSVSSVIRTRYPVHNVDFGEPPQKSSPSRELPEELKKIDEILDRTVRPGLQADGGDIELIDYKDNVLRILYQGACGGCPSAMMGTLEAIQNILRHELKNPDLKVEPL